MLWFSGAFHSVAGAAALLQLDLAVTQWAMQCSMVTAPLGVASRGGGSTFDVGFCHMES